MKADAEILKQLYKAKNPQEIAEIYNQWSKNYDEGLNEGSGYVAPQWCLKLLEKYVPSKDAHLLDAGAGTGLFGQLLHQRGYHNIVGIDVSEGMLEEARKKNVYTEVHQKILGEPLGFPTDSFDATISVGVFSPGQGSSSAFDELIRITKPGGYIIFTIQPQFYENSDFGFKPKQLELEIADKWVLEEKTEKFQGLPKSEPDLFYNVWVYKVC
ncbi:methyltransferase [Candidatus Thiomargarita nelsonii]|uniref:Methyltransferase n=1 Tax=Candidatus Thiomargarita nelsonii TaxID=1003181 RepID=A0A0A6RT73_9GAMM|nr:methyltransferase [Candidatus Thiomargarita nelsonii]